MSACTRNWRIVFLTLLMGFGAIAASTAALAAANAGKSTNLSGVAPLTAHFDASLSTCPGGCAYFEWYFVEDNSNVRGVTTNYTYKVVGTHTATLYAFDSTGTGPGHNTSIDVTVTVLASSNPPTADITKSPNVKGAVPFTAQFDASKSNCDNTCGSYAWNFGDGTSATINDSPIATHTYTAVGTYNVSMTVTDKSNGKKATSAPLQVKVVPAESLTSYVQECKTQLNFQNIPNLDCYDGDLFATPDDFNKNGSVRDFVGYKKITDQVDVAFACRWLGGDKTTRANPISVELLAHNRQSGNTCFFSAKGFISGDANPI
ncbi:MAG TPA: PKD domain-containing protein, partial [Povalibacter sp.]